MGSYDEDYQVCQDCLTYDAETEVHDAESFIAYPELKDHLVSIMPNKVYDIVELDDGDFEMKVLPQYLNIKLKKNQILILPLENLKLLLQ